MQYQVIFWAMNRPINTRIIKKAGRPGGDHAIRWLGVFLKIAEQFSKNFPKNHISWSRYANHVKEVCVCLAAELLNTHHITSKKIK
jgi:hypothetical protein